jgi:hypothetical protein
MAKTSLDDGVFYRSAYQNATQQLRLVETELPQDAISNLAREVVRRLAFRMPRHENVADLPTQSEIDLLCAACCQGMTGLRISSSLPPAVMVSIQRRSAVAMSLVLRANWGRCGMTTGFHSSM